MNILYDYQILREQKYGGISRYFYELITEIKNNNLCYPDIRCLFNKNVYFENQLSNIFREDVPISFPKGFINRIYYLFLLKFGKYDIFHPTYYKPYFWGKNKGKVVITVYDMIHELFPECFNEIETVNNKKLAIHNADHLIAISESTKRDILRLYPEIDPKKITVIYISSRFNESDNYLSYRSQFPEKYILFVGNRKTYKNFDRFFTAIEPILASDPSLYLVCLGGGAFDRDEAEMIEHLKSRVFQMDTSDDVLKCAYKYAECFVFPSLYEGFGIPTLEAFACDCPVLLSNTSSMPEVGGNAAVYFDPYNINDMSEKIRMVIYNEEKKIEMIKKGREQLAKFDWHQIALQTVDCYKNVLRREN